MNGEHSEWRSPKSDTDGNAIAGNFYFNALNDEFFRDVFRELSITQSSGYNTGLDVYADYPASPAAHRTITTGNHASPILPTHMDTYGDNTVASAVPSLFRMGTTWPSDHRNSYMSDAYSLDRPLAIDSASQIQNATAHVAFDEDDKHTPSPRGYEDRP